MGYWLLKAILAPLLRSLYRVEVEGREYVPSKGAVVIAANHLSFIDSLFIPLVLRRRITFLAKAEYFRDPLKAWFFRIAGQIPCDRTDGDEALDCARDHLEKGRAIALYPEGTRSPDGRLYRGRTGVARLAFTSGVPVVPCGLKGTDKVMPRGHRRPRVRGRKRVQISFGPPVELARWTGNRAEPELLRPATDVVMYRIRKLSQQCYVDGYASARSPEGASPATRLDPSRPRSSGDRAQVS